MKAFRMSSTTAQITAVLQAVKGAKIATIITETVPEMKKRNNPYLNVVKRSTLNMVFNFNYRAAVNKALNENDITVQVGNKAGKRVWGEKVPNSPFIMHNGAMYLELKLNRPADKVQYFLDGKEVAADQVTPYLYKRNAKLVPMNDIKIQNIKELRVNGMQYVVNG